MVKSASGHALDIKYKLPKPSTSKTNSEALSMSTSVQSPLEIKDFKFKSIYDFEELLDKKFSDFSTKPMDLSKNFADEMENTFDFKNHVSLEFNKLRGYPKNNSGNPKFAHKPSRKIYYYSRPTPQEVLIEERDWNQTNTSYSGSEIYECNLDGLTDKRLTIFVHRMLMYATICKNIKNTDRNICKMIIAGFTGQLRGLWDNYMSLEQKVVVINATFSGEGVDNLGMAPVANREDTVYTLVLTILEHFNGRFTNQYENEGINLCNELKLSRQLKVDKLKERSQIGDFCTQFGLPDAPANNKKKHMDSNDSRNLDKCYRKKSPRYRSKED
ncbi:hypothetical protein MTR67_042618 [Solanum verrucosum]|uniref:DUF7746 domain-containing protein n=1 Tax=Solanum verrucosum TaxID=315347 RepID=A0AAF0ZTJ8_SOLVR|nr:hypothetical protein MTR67_042618 [Solanum verrucosum]